MKAPGKHSIRRLATNFATNTSMHGWPRLFISKGIFRKLAWVMLTLAGVGLAMYHLGKIVQTFRTYPVSTLLSIENKNKLDFPAVTVCNMNPARRSALKEIADRNQLSELLELIEEADAKRKEEENEDEEEEEEKEEEGEEDTQTDAEFFDALSQEFKVATAFGQLMATLNKEDRRESGHELGEMLLGCTYEGRQCSAENFTFSYNSKFGNCYTFNSDPNLRLVTKKPGPLYGLEMELYLEEYEYSEFLADIVGAKLLVHQQGIMPFPEDDGVSLSPGASTSIGISQVIIERSVPPHGNCSHYSTNGNELFNVYASTNAASYSEKACTKTCYQKSLISTCKCCHFDYPCEGVALEEVLETENSQGRPVNRRCNESDAIDKVCMDTVYGLYEQDKLPCSSDCRQPCRELIYSTDISSGTWPSIPLVRRTMGKVRQVYKRRNVTIPDSDDLSETDDQLEFLVRNVIKVEIFYKQLNYEHIKTTPAYDWSSLISDIGGQAGLWVGFSILTIAELLELLLDIVMVIGGKVFGLTDTRVETINIQPVQKQSSTDA